MQNVTKRTTNCIQWVKTLMPMPSRWCNPPTPPLWFDRDFLCNFCPAFVSFFSRLNRKIRLTRLLVTVRVFCLFHTASKCTQTYHFGAKKIFLWGRDQPPPLHPTPIGVHGASPPY